MQRLFSAMGTILFLLCVNLRADANEFWSYDADRSFRVELTADSPFGEASIREHAIVWHPEKQKYYLLADVVPLSSIHHPNTYETEIHLWSSTDLAQWQHHGVAIEKGASDRLYHSHGVASPAGAVFWKGKIFVPFSARRTELFRQRGIGLAWSSNDPEELPWTKSNKPISDLEGEDDDPALMTISGDTRLHLYHRRTGPGGYRIVHTTCTTPQKAGEWPAAKPVVPRPKQVRAQELTGVYYVKGRCHLLVIEHLIEGGTKIAHLVSGNPAGPFLAVENANRYLTSESQPQNRAYSGHITPVVRNNELTALFWTVPQQGKRYGLLGHPINPTKNQ